MIAYLAAIFLLGVLVGGTFGYYSAERTRAEREREAFRKMKAWRE